MYRVIKKFNDMNDGRHAYNTGDTFPREGLNVTTERINQLLSSSNALGVPLIEEVKEEVKEEIKEEPKKRSNKE